MAMLFISTKINPLKTLIFSLGMISAQFTLADTCPLVDDITDSLLEDQMDWSVYLSPGWHSDLVHEDDADVVAFDKVLTDRFGPKCVFTTDSGSINMYPNQDPANPKGIDINELMQNKMWYCSPKLLSNNPTNEQICVCNSSRERCTFTLVPLNTNTAVNVPDETITTTQTVIQSEQ